MIHEVEPNPYRPGSLMIATGDTTMTTNDPKVRNAFLREKFPIGTQVRTLDGSVGRVSRVGEEGAFVSYGGLTAESRGAWYYLDTLTPIPTDPAPEDRLAALEARVDLHNKAIVSLEQWAAGHSTTHQEYGDDLIQATEMLEDIKTLVRRGVAPDPTYTAPPVSPPAGEIAPVEDQVIHGPLQEVFRAAVKASDQYVGGYRQSDQYVGGKAAIAEAERQGIEAALLSRLAERIGYHWDHELYMDYVDDPAIVDARVTADGKTAWRPDDWLRAQPEAGQEGEG